ncbi:MULTISPECIES: hypothetical protein [Rhizobium/Agrobacterium group]|uniref:hypothetical protein n=1 Tax=Rhizobium/Agrobacterium group TaxID=227290 RepID=UPI00138689F2|nr:MULTISPECIES: hypothetical protein [Rhizobium/Agrobacterium group]
MTVGSFSLYRQERIDNIQGDTFAATQRTISPEYRLGLLPTKPSYLHHASSAGTERNFEIAAASPGVIDECPASAIDAADISEATVLNELLTLPARYGAAKIEIGTDMNVDRHGIGWSRYRYRQDKASSESKRRPCCGAHLVSSTSETLGE